MIHCFCVEGFFFPPNNGLLVLGVEGSVPFEELGLRLHLIPHEFYAYKKKKKIMRFGFEKEEDKKRMRKMGRRK